MDYVLRPVWSMLNVDDACIFSRSPQGLAKMVKVIVEVCRAFALIVSAKKTETMCMPPRHTPWTIVRVELRRRPRLPDVEVAVRGRGGYFRFAFECLAILIVCSEIIKIPEHYFSG